MDDDVYTHACIYTHLYKICVRVKDLKIALGRSGAQVGRSWAECWPNFRGFESKFVALGSTLVALVRNLAQVGRFGVQVGRAGAKFGPSWSLLGRFWPPTRVHFGASALLLRSSGSTRSQKSRTSFRLGMGESKRGSQLLRVSEKSTKNTPKDVS